MRRSPPVDVRARPSPPQRRCDANAAIAKADALDRKFGQGNPIAARGLAKLEAKSITDRQEPEGAQERQAGLDDAGGEAADDPRRVRRERERRLHRVVRADRVRRDRLQARRGAERTAAQQHPRTPPTTTSRTTTRCGSPDFSSEHFNKMLFTDEGITERVRTDLTGPDGKPGFDISGYTMKAMYEEMSRGAYTVHRLGDPVDHRAPLRGLLRREPLLPERGGRLRGRRDPGHAGPPRQPARPGPAARSTPWRRSRTRSPTSPGPTTTSRTRATVTTTATCSSPTA